MTILDLKHFTLKHILYLKIIGLLAVIGVLCKENGITILVSLRIDCDLIELILTILFCSQQLQQ